MKKIKILLALLAIAQFAFAQAPVSPKSHSMGILLSMDYSNLMAKSRESNNVPEYTTLETEAGWGFSMGVFYRLRLNENFAILPQAVLAFQDNKVDFRLQNQTTQKVEIQPVTVEFPIHLVFTKNFGKSISPSVALGAKYVHDISEREGDFQQDFNRSNFALDVGGGVEIDFKKFKLKPELLYSFGMTNLKNNNNDLLNYEVGRVIRDKFSIRILFYN